MDEVKIELYEGKKIYTRKMPQLIERFIPSKDMKDYLKEVFLNDYRLLDIVVLSPVSLEQKKEEVRNLLAISSDDGDEILADLCTKLLKDFDTAENARTGDGIFSINHCAYNHQIKDCISNFQTLCSSFDAAMQCIKVYSKYDEEENNPLQRYEIISWKNAENGRLKEVCTYTIVRNELWYQRIENYSERLAYTNIEADGDLNLPVPFAPGDIIEVNGFPFGPTVHILITGIGDNNDCCCVQGIAKDEEGYWNKGAVKHGMVGYRYFPKVPYLFNAEKYCGKLCGDEEMLIKLRDYLCEHPEKLERFEEYYSEFFFDVTDEEIQWMIDVDFNDQELEKHKEQ